MRWPWIVAVTVACTTHDAPVPSDVTVPVGTLPLRTLALDEAVAQLWPRGERHVWREPTAAEARTLEVLVPGLLEAAASGAIAEDLPALAAGVDLVVEHWVVDGQGALVLREADGRRRGAGAYLFAEGVAPSAGWTLLEVPHAWADRGTDTVGARLFFSAPDRPTALFTNSVHRDAGPDGERVARAGSAADACHNDHHPLALATKAAADARAGVTVVQLHGFARDGVEDPPRGTVAVIGTGDRQATEVAVAVRDRLAERLGGGVVLAAEVGVLRAETNVEARLLRDVAGARFVHVELSDTLRERLVASRAESLSLGVGLLDVVRR